MSTEVDRITELHFIAIRKENTNGTSPSQSLRNGCCNGRYLPLTNGINVQTFPFIFVQ